MTFGKATHFNILQSGQSRDPDDSASATMTRSTTTSDPITCPFVVLVDSREQLPYRFTGLRSDYRQRYRPITVETRWQLLATGDYSIEGYADRVAVERKSLDDAYHTIGSQRDRFERELERLDAMDFAAVVVEAEWSTILRDPPEWSRLRPKIVYRSIIAWQQRYPSVHWWFVPGRRLAEISTFRILQRFYKGAELCSP